MKSIQAKILDSTHLELAEPIPLSPGETITISVPDRQEGDRTWEQSAQKKFLNAYSEEDSIYDDL
ncbi:MAG: hypothetical protein IID61_10745 [SAR324 cluster bacterium]|nr:hypothetical protein [SAR324 cluster bacterium]